VACEHAKQQAVRALADLVARRASADLVARRASPQEPAYAQVVAPERP